MVSHYETGSDPPIGSDRESGSDNGSQFDNKLYRNIFNELKVKKLYSTLH